jgi:hypothetical protein
MQQHASDKWLPRLRLLHISGQSYGIIRASVCQAAAMIVASRPGVCFEVDISCQPAPRKYTCKVNWRAYLRSGFDEVVKVIRRHSALCVLVMISARNKDGVTTLINHVARLGIDQRFALIRVRSCSTAESSHCPAGFNQLVLRQNSNFDDQSACRDAANNFQQPVVQHLIDLISSSDDEQQGRDEGDDERMYDEL